MKIDTKAPVAAARSTSGISDLIDALNEAERAGADPRTIGRFEGQIAALACESLDDVRHKIDFALCALSMRAGAEIECEALRTAAEFLRAKPGVASS